MADLAQLEELLKQRFAAEIVSISQNVGELTIEIRPTSLHSVCKILRDDEAYSFEQLIDLCVVDYLTYGTDEWETDQATSTGFERGVDRSAKTSPDMPRRFAVVYHLLSLRYNRRLRVKTFVHGDPGIVSSVTDVWASASWYEREAFDLYGVLFDGHPDLRRILTDYGFVGHPLRKDFPVSGHVEVRYDPTEQRVIYQPVSIQPRVLVPKVIRHDHRYVEAPVPPPKAQGSK